MLYAVIPFGDGFQVIDLNIGVFYFLSIGSVRYYRILMAGWGSNNKWSLLGAMRGVAQMITYENTFGLNSLLGVVMITAHLGMSDIIAAQSNIWFIFILPIAFLIYLISATAELNRGPFDNALKLNRAYSSDI